MKRQDFLLIALVPSCLLLLPLVGNLTVEGWNWKWNDFLAAWVVFTLTTAFFRFLLTRQLGNLAYKLGAACAVLTGFVILWVTMAVQIIGEDNPGNVLYLFTLLGGLIGGLFVRFRAAGLARVAFAMALALLAIPAVAVVRWPADFSPGYPQVQLLSAGLAAMFVAAGLFFRRAASQAAA